jgi:cation/acetate symporter
MKRARALISSSLLVANNTFAADKTVARVDSRVLTFSVFAAMFLLRLAVAFVAARRGSSVKEFCTARAGISPRLNGIAIAGDYLSAVAFIGVSGHIALYGLDGVSCLVGFLCHSFRS